MDSDSSSCFRSRTPSAGSKKNAGQLSVEVADALEMPGEGRPRRHPLTANGSFITSFEEGITTLYESFQNATSKYADRNLLGWRPKLDGVAQDYVFMSFREMRKRVADFSSGLWNLGLESKCAVGLYSVNRPEWVIAEYACYSSNFITVPLYDTLGEEAIEHICGQTEMRVVVASNDMALPPTLQTIICMDNDISEELRSAAAAVNLKLVAFSDVQENGAEHPVEATPPAPEDLCTICYTSGTTGLPKGVMLPHKAILADASSILALAGIGNDKRIEKAHYLFSLDSGVVHISYLPLAHVYERVVMTTLIAIGACIGFYQGDNTKLLEDIQSLRPTLFIAVPRLLNRVYDKIMAGVGSTSGISKFLFNYAYQTKAANLQSSGTFDHWLWDRLVFSKIRNRLGGRVTAILSGSAPLSPDVMDFLRICFSCEVYEGYGQTETSAGSTLSVRGDWTSGQIGVPVPSNEVKLVDIPEMGYMSTDKPRPRGEVCIRGVNCFTGYYKCPELTSEALDPQGWVHTGDVGEWDEKGRLRIIDRKKNLFKLAQGEYVSPEKVENVLSRIKYIAQAYVTGNSLRSFLVAVIVPDFEVLGPWAQSQGLTDNPEKLNELVKLPQVKELLLNEIKALRSKLKGFEIPRNIYITSEAFSIENGLLTSTMKLKRHEAKKQYAEQVAAMYQEMKD